jgi:hypothetical protein
MTRKRRACAGQMLRIDRQGGRIVPEYFLERLKNRQSPENNGVQFGVSSKIANFKLCSNS